MVYEFEVNGTRVTSEDGDKTLLRFLREDLNLVGAKDGCSRAQCGACTVIVNGKAVRSCAKKLKNLSGASVQTIEGIGSPDKLHPIQTAFLVKHAFQCGFCTPGLIMATKALLDANPHPTEEQIKEALKFNICRCTGYKQVLEAVELAIEILDGKRENTFDNGMGWVGESPVSKHGIERVTGAPLFTDDFKLDHPLQGKILLPKYPHAKILNIDVSAAEAMPGVVKVLTYKDIPGENWFSEEEHPQPVFASSKINCIGDAVAVVLAETEEQATAALPAVVVDYEPLPVMSTPEEAMADNAIRIHENFPNAFAETHVVKGNIVRGFAQADVIVENSFQTQRIDHATMELDASLAEPGEDGRLNLYGTAQSPNKIKADVCRALAIDSDQLHYINRAVGGGFGGREDVTCHIFAALGAMLTKRAVRVVMTREQVNAMTPKKHPVTLKYKIGAKKDGTLTAIESRAIGDTGAYNTTGDFVLRCVAAMGSGPYAVPNTDLKSTTVFTNNMSSGAMRGYGSTQVAVAVETTMDMLAEKLGMDPYEFRMKNALKIGDQTPTGQIIDFSCGLKDCLKAAKLALDNDQLPQPSGANKKIGVGMACSFKNMGVGNGLVDGAGARIRLDKNGKFMLLTGCVELGQGHDTVVCQIAAQTLGVKYDDVNIGFTNDDDYPHTTGSTNASRATYMSGNAVYTASVMLKRKVFDFVASVWEREVDFLDADTEGIFDLRDNQNFRATYKDIADAAVEKGKKLEVEYYYQDKLHNWNIDSENIDHSDSHKMFSVYIFSAQIAVVEVDTETGKVDVKHIYAASDLGKTLNPHLALGQMYGSIMMGQGYCLSEEMKMQDGYMVSKDLRSLGLPTIKDTPEITPILIEEGSPYGPYGAKGFTEGALNPTAPAILNAIYDAVGVRFNSLPVTKEAVIAALRNK